MKRALLAFAAVALAACSIPQDMSRVENAVAVFHQLQSEGRDQDIYLAADPALRDSARLDQLIYLNNGVRALAPSCSPPQRDPQAWSFNTSSGEGATASVMYRRDCQGRTLVEEFRFRMGQDGPRLMFYRADASNTAQGEPPQRPQPPPPPPPANSNNGARDI